MIIKNTKALHDYHIEERYESGIVLEGWEVKAIRAGRSNIKEAYVTVMGAELMLIGAHISPLAQTSSHVTTIPTRTRKLLLHKKEIDKLIGKVKLAGYTIVPLNFHYSKGRIKCEIGLAKGKKMFDKRVSERDRDIKREVDSTMKQNLR